MKQKPLSTEVTVEPKRLKIEAIVFVLFIFGHRAHPLTEKII